MVKFLTLIKKDGEALGVRSSNESMFMCSRKVSVLVVGGGGRGGLPSCEPTAELGHGSH